MMKMRRRKKRAMTNRKVYKRMAVVILSSRGLSRGDPHAINIIKESSQACFAAD